MKQQTEAIPCALCRRSLERRADKNNKPYFVCESCGTQYFIRGVAGRERLSALLECGEFSNANNVKQQRLSAGEQKALLNDLEKLQGYIETFCQDETVIPNEPFSVANAVSFPKWSGEICTRISRVLNPSVKP